MRRRWIVLFLALAAVGAAQPKRVLYVTHSAGYRHDSIPLSTDVMRELAPGELEVTATEDVSLLTADGLRNFDAVFFFTSGELPLRDDQKRALLDFVRAGKGFGGVHSATDTLYTWPEYKELIGATFDGHPWVQKVRMDIEDPANPIVSHLAPGWEVEEEIYQHRDFSRSRVRVLMTLDTAQVNTAAPDVKRTDGDFALAWVQPHGAGRVFYTALGHFELTWRDAGFQQMLRQALRWLTGRIEAPAEPRPLRQPAIAPGGWGNAATLTPRALSPGAIFTLFGENLTAGAESAAVTPDAPRKLAGAVARVNGEAVPLLYASPGQINAIAPAGLTGTSCDLEVAVAGMPPARAMVPLEEWTPGVFAVVNDGNGTASIWATGLGTVRPRVEVNGVDAPVLFSGLAPGGSACTR